MAPTYRTGRGAGTHAAGADVMPTTLKTAAEKGPAEDVRNVL